MKTYQCISFVLAVAAVNAQAASRTSAQDVVILSAPMTVAPPSPTGEGTDDSVSDNISVETTDSKDLIFHYSNILQGRLSRAIDSCKNRTEDVCFNSVQTTLLESSPQLHKRVVGAVVIGAVAVLMQILVSYTILQSHSGLGYATVPSSIRIPSSDISAVQSAVSATKSVAIAPQTSALPIPWVINQGIIVDNTTDADYLTFLINDGVIYEYLLNTGSNNTCTSSAELRRRDTDDCVVDDAVQALRFFATSKSHAFESLTGMPRLPSVQSIGIQRDMSKFLELSAGIDSFAGFSLDVKNNVALGLILINQRNTVKKMINNVIRVNKRLLADSPTVSTAKSLVSYSAPPSSHFILPKSNGIPDLVDVSLRSALWPTSLRRNRFASARWDYWDTIITEVQARGLEAELGNVKVVADEQIPKEGFLITDAPPEAPNPTAIPSTYRGKPVRRQAYSPRDEYDDLVDYSMNPIIEAQGKGKNERGDNDYVYPDLANIDTWVYLIEEGVDTSHKDFDGRVWKYSPLVHPDMDWQLGGKYGNAGDGRGTCLASKIAGTRFGTAKNSSIILVAVPLRLSSLWWAFGAIHQDIQKRQRDGQAVPRKTVIVNGLSWDKFTVYSSLAQNKRDPDEEEVRPLLSPLEQIRLLVFDFGVPVVQGIKGWMANPPHTAFEDPDYSTVPAGWAELRLINVVGSTAQYDWDVLADGVHVDLDLRKEDNSYSARSSEVVCALPQNRRTLVQYGSSGVAAAAAGGTLLNALVHLPQSKYEMPWQGDPSLAVGRVLRAFDNGRLLSSGHINPNIDTDSVWTWQRLADGPLIAWNKYDGRRDCIPAQLARRQFENVTDQCVPLNTTVTTARTSTGEASEASKSSRAATTFTITDSSVPSSTITSAAALPSLSTFTIECSTSYSGQTSIPKDYASTGIANFCTSNSRSYGQKTVDRDSFNANYYVPRRDNGCNGQPPLTVGLGLFPNEPETQTYHGWPVDVCNGIMSRIVEKCEWGGKQRVGFIEGSLGGVAICRT